MWNEDPEFLEEVLGTCSLRRSLTVEKTYVTHNENLALDVEAARDRHRRDLGYVTPLSATAFLKRIRISSLDELLIDGSYDGYSAMQLRSMQRRSPGHDDNDNSLPMPEQEAPEPEETDRPAEQALEELHAIFSPLLQPPALDVLLLDAPKPQQSYLELQLMRLGTKNPAIAETRRQEILY